MRRLQNQSTQPFISHSVFNNWDVVAKGWFLVCRSRSVKKGKLKAVELCGQRVVLFRGEDSKIRALDGFCPHMGADLSIGKVDGNFIRCFFHHWKFDSEGNCVDIPCGEKIPPRAKTQGYAAEDKYGFIWIYPDMNPSTGVPEYPELEGREVYYQSGRAFERPCHHHVNMINGIDAQHLRSVHKIPIDMSLKVDESSNGEIIDFRMSCPWPKFDFKQRFISWLVGGQYSYSMRYVQASVGLLRVAEEVRWFSGKRQAEPMRMIFAYTPLGPGRSGVQPIYIAEKTGGWLRRLKAQFILLGMKFGFYYLRDEDGAIYDNIRFSPNALLKMDKGVARFIAWVNKLPLCDWSTTGEYLKLGKENRRDSSSSTDKPEQQSTSDQGE